MRWRGGGGKYLGGVVGVELDYDCALESMLAIVSEWMVEMWGSTIVVSRATLVAMMQLCSVAVLLNRECVCQIPASIELL